MHATLTRYMRERVVLPSERGAASPRSPPHSDLLAHVTLPLPDTTHHPHAARHAYVAVAASDAGGDANGPTNAANAAVAAVACATTLLRVAPAASPSMCGRHYT